MSSIGFVAPLFLFGSAAALLVLLIHLLKRPKTVSLTFSTLRFFNESAVTARRTRKLRRLLLLIVRMLLLIIIAFIFSGPYFLTDRLHLLHDSSTPLYLWIDPTPSMTYKEKNESPQEQALRLLDTVTALRTGKSPIMLYHKETNTFMPYRRNAELPLQQTLHVRREALFAECAHIARKAPRAVFIFISDFQGTIGSSLDSLSELPEFSRSLLIATPLSPREPWNTWITRVEAINGSEPYCNVSLRNSSPTPVSGQIHLTTSTMRTIAATCTLASGTDTTITVPAPALTPGTGGSVRFSGNDPMLFDNTRYFTSTPPVQRTILVLGTPTETFPVTAALGAHTSGTASRTITQSTHEAFSIRALQSADILFVCSSPVARQSLELIASTPASHAQACIIAYDSSSTTPGNTWRSRKRPLSVNLSDTVSNLWRGFPSLQAKGVKIYGYLNGLTGKVLARLSNDTPFITLRDTGSRTTISLATPVGITTANNLCETAFYLPLLDRLIRVSEQSIAHTRTPWIVGAAQKNPYFGNTTAVPVLNEEGNEEVLLQKQPYFTIKKPGYYRVSPPDAPDFLQTAVINPDESRTDYNPPTARTDHRLAVLSARNLPQHSSTTKSQLPTILSWICVALLLFLELFLRERNVSASQDNPQSRGKTGT